MKRPAQPTQSLSDLFADTTTDETQERKDANAQYSEKEQTKRLAARVSPDHWQRLTLLLARERVRAGRNISMGELIERLLDHYAPPQ